MDAYNSLYGFAGGARQFCSKFSFFTTGEFESRSGLESIVDVDMVFNLNVVVR